MRVSSSIYSLRKSISNKNGQKALVKNIETEMKKVWQQWTLALQFKLFIILREKSPVKINCLNGCMPEFRVNIQLLEMVDSVCRGPKRAVLR